ncbi:MAG: hypothetical protein WKF92_10820 [Pyrinomonadaceae bacterium]
MKNLKNAISLIGGCMFLSTLVSLDAIAQIKPKPQQKPSAKIVKCKDNDSDCFIRAANTCRKATLTMNKPLLEGMMNPDVPHPTYIQTYRYESGAQKTANVHFTPNLKRLTLPLARITSVT